MPSTNQAGSAREYPSFPDVEERIGENPARFLDWDLLSKSDARELAMARIRGLDSVAAANCWLRVERELDRGPRDRIVEAIRERLQWLVEHGDREERVANADPSEVSRPEKRILVDGEPKHERSKTAHERVQEMRGDA